MNAALRHLVVDRDSREEKDAGGEPEALKHTLRRRHATDQGARQVQERLDPERHERKHHEVFVNFGAMPEQQSGHYENRKVQKHAKRAPDAGDGLGLGEWGRSRTQKESRHIATEIRLAKCAIDDDGDAP